MSADTAECLLGVKTAPGENSNTSELNVAPQDGHLDCPQKCFQLAETFLLGPSSNSEIMWIPLESCLQIPWISYSLFNFQFLFH